MNDKTKILCPNFQIPNFFLHEAVRLANVIEGVADIYRG